MCGIVGVVGNTNATDILIQGLEKLEYRGYDSAGVFITDGTYGHLVKSVGRIADLTEKLVIIYLGLLELVIPAGRHMESQLKIMLILIHHKQDVLYWYIMV